MTTQSRHLPLGLSEIYQFKKKFFFFCVCLVHCPQIYFPYCLTLKKKKKEEILLISFDFLLILISCMIVTFCCILLRWVTPRIICDDFHLISASVAPKRTLLTSIWFHMYHVYLMDKCCILDWICMVYKSPVCLLNLNDLQTLLQTTLVLSVRWWGSLT